MNDRNELKFICNESQLLLIRSRIASLLTLDSYSRENSSYRIRSLYFDDIDDSFYHSVLQGDDDRFKFRIRTYNLDTSMIRLERKWKKNFLTRKDSCVLSREECELLLSDQLYISEKLFDRSPVLRHIALLRNTTLLRPVLLIEYFREAYTYKVGNVRITFDRWISSTPCTKLESMFYSALPLVPLLTAGKHVLEIKYDSFLPDFIADRVDIGSLEQTSFSKYSMCRNMTSVIKR